MPFSHNTRPVSMSFSDTCKYLWSLVWTICVNTGHEWQSVRNILNHRMSTTPFTVFVCGKLIIPIEFVRVTKDIDGHVFVSKERFTHRRRKFLHTRSSFLCFLSSMFPSIKIEAYRVSVIFNGSFFWSQCESCIWVIFQNICLFGTFSEGWTGSWIDIMYRNRETFVPLTGWCVFWWLWGDSVLLKKKRNSFCLVSQGQWTTMYTTCPFPLIQWMYFSSEFNHQLTSIQ
jgi:hypothetical protein